MDKSENSSTANPHLLGGGCYHNLVTHRLTADKKIVKLVPLRVPWRMMIATNCLFATGFAAFFYLATLKQNALWVFVAITGIGVATCIGFDVIVYFIFRNSIRRGPVLTYDRMTGKIALPSYGEVFTCEDNVYLECITARQSPAERNVEGELNSELNLVLSENGSVKRWNLMRSIATIRPFGKLETQLANELPIPVRRVTGR